MSQAVAENSSRPVATANAPVSGSTATVGKAGAAPPFHATRSSLIGVSLHLGATLLNG